MALFCNPATWRHGVYMIKDDGLGNSQDVLETIYWSLLVWALPESSLMAEFGGGW